MQADNPTPKQADNKLYNSTSKVDKQANNDNQIKRHKLTKKQRKLAELVATTDMTNRQAYKMAYDTKTDNNNTIDVEASRTLNKPQVRTELERYNKLIENTLINTINDYKDSDKIRERKLAVNTSQFIYEHLHGKPTQQIKTDNKTLSITLDLTGVDATPADNESRTQVGSNRGDKTN